MGSARSYEVVFSSESKYMNIKGSDTCEYLWRTRKKIAFERRKKLFYPEDLEIKYLLNSAHLVDEIRLVTVFQKLANKIH